ncbi:hypothetical protein ymoll0001_17120 [Yersinia mollaretii ATCC 43969]|uniref:Uncharacterized protein n=1 Tax=Yersinia mollaretii (strain ATCC 43969 / DSM 18520 / CIP 103324 / CNY 7263 / WAIP 204) TaxID=349967 RepID=A0ABM9Y554_YERMW|nr:hypothetical protein ymoll0001_17120 [Yersinia mollaretii ATCC 43969]
MNVTYFELIAAAIINRRSTAISLNLLCSQQFYQRPQKTSYLVIK